MCYTHVHGCCLMKSRPSSAFRLQFLIRFCLSRSHIYISMHLKKNMFFCQEMMILSLMVLGPQLAKATISGHSHCNNNNNCCPFRVLLLMLCLNAAARIIIILSICISVQMCVRMVARRFGKHWVFLGKCWISLMSDLRLEFWFALVIALWWSLCSLCASWIAFGPRRPSSNVQRRDQTRLEMFEVRDQMTCAMNRICWMCQKIVAVDHSWSSALLDCLPKKPKLGHKPPPPSLKEAIFDDSRQMCPWKIDILAELNCDICTSVLSKYLLPNK